MTPTRTKKEELMGIRTLVLRGLAWSMLSALVAAGGCSIDEVTFPCHADPQCDDRDPCTKDVCEPEGRCSHDPDDGASGRACGDAQRSKCYAGKCLPCAAMDPAPGDCRNLACDEAGKVVEVNDDSDVPPDDGVECTDSACRAGAPVHPVSAAGTACRSGGFCNASGACVPCFGQQGCDVAKGYFCFGEAECVSCNDGVQDGQESHTDCGGPDCPGCLGDPCSGNADCQTGSTCADGYCCVTACAGSCEACAFSLTGVGNGQCAPLKAGMLDGENCAAQGGCGAVPGTCACDDGLLDNGEAGVDCGGACGDCGPCMECSLTGCVPLPAGSESGCDGDSRCDGLGSCKRMYGKPCEKADDCLSSYCPDQGPGVQKVCAHCSTQLDCGDTQKYNCRAGACRTDNLQSCSHDIECASFNCKMGTCIGCFTDGDCASGACNGFNCLYVSGMPCNVNFDCMLGVCNEIDPDGQRICP